MLRLLKRTFRPVRLESPLPPAGPLSPERALRQSLFFCHVPKTAGTTLRSFLEQHYPTELICSVRELKQRREEAAGNTQAPPAFVYAHFNARPLLSNEFNLITILRDPFDRVRSLYRHWGQFSEYNLVNSPAPERVNELKRLARTMSMNDFLRIDEWPIQRHFHNGLVKSLVPGYDQHVAGRYNDRDLLEAAVQTLHDALCVGITDRFDDFVRFVCFHLRWPPPRTHQSLNVRSESYQAADDGLDAIIAPHTALDAQVLEKGRRIFEKQFAAMHHSLVTDDALKAVPGDQSTDELLDLRARNTLVEAARTSSPPSSRALDMRMPLRGAGWLEREGIDTNRPYRWTGPGCETTVDCLIRRAKSYTACLRVVSVIHEDILRDCRITLNGMDAAAIHIAHSGDVREVCAEFDGSAVGEDSFARLTIVVPRTATHLELHPGCGDGRRKGLAIERISIDAQD